MKASLALFAVLLSLGLVSSSTIARADADDAAWIKKCVSDNKREGATPEVVAAYCSCMNGKMSSDETKSITAWEKTHPAEMARLRQGIRLEVIGAPALTCFTPAKKCSRYRHSGLAAVRQSGMTSLNSSASTTLAR